MSEPAEDAPKTYASGGYVKPEPMLTEPRGYVDPKFGTRIELDAAEEPHIIKLSPETVKRIAEAAGKVKGV